jgi:HAD superfamily phosphatase (TIGR01668 family)
MLIRPTYYIDGDITDLDQEMLTEAGIKGLILDLDSTLMAPKTGSLDAEADRWLTRARGAFKMVILSNNKRHEYLEAVEKKLDLFIIGHAAKPFASGFEKALEHLNLTKEEVAAVGDRALTDILGGQLFNIRTILVMPLKSIKEPAWKTCLRDIERSLARR